MIFNILRDIHEYEGCFCCQALVVNKKHYCEVCFQYLKNTMAEHLIHRGDEKYDLFSLWNWSPLSERPILENLLISAKSRASAQPLRPWVIEFLTRRLRFSTINFENTAFVVPPSERLFNHSLALALEFTRALCLEGKIDLYELRVTKNSNVKTTKDLSLSQRRLIGKKLFDLPHIEKNYRTWILIDDIVTTGFTAKRVFKTLGEPKDFEVWSLASRSRLATDS